MNERKHRSNLTEYGIQLKQKQKVRNVYGLSEKQFARYVKEATTEKGANPVDLLYEKLERRLDNVVYRLGFAKSRTMARQMVAHGHFMVGKRKLTIPSYQVKNEDVIGVREGSKSSTLFTTMKETLSKASTPNWILPEPTKLTATVKGTPKFDKNEMGFNFQSVIEFYSR
jgi:small subunit ribosomal protein S4